MGKEKQSPFSRVIEEYAFNPWDADSPDTEKVQKAKYIIGRLPLEDRTLIVKYIEVSGHGEGGLRELGKEYGLSHTAIAKEIKRVRQRILEEYKKIQDVDL